MNVQFVLDYRSIYSYLANSQMRTLGSIVDYRPVDIVAVMKEVNNQPSPMCPPKARYSLMDAMRWARRYNVPLSPNEALLSAMKQGKFKGELLSRAGLAAQHMGIFEQVNDALFSATWAGTDDLVTEDGRSRFLTNHAIPDTLWERADAPDVVAELAINNEHAIENGVFGVPTFFVDREMFFGNDRLSFVKEKLDESTKGAYDE